METLERVLQKYIKMDAETETSDILQDKNDVVEYLKRYINENFDKELSLETLGAIVHLHPSYLSKIFKEVSNVNIRTWLL